MIMTSRIVAPVAGRKSGGDKKDKKDDKGGKKGGGNTRSRSNSNCW